MSADAELHIVQTGRSPRRGQWPYVPHRCYEGGVWWNFEEVADAMHAKVFRIAVARYDELVNGAAREAARRLAALRATKSYRFGKVLGGFFADWGFDDQIHCSARPHGRIVRDRSRKLLVYVWAVAAIVGVVRWLLPRQRVRGRLVVADRNGEQVRNITDHHDGHGLAEDISIIADDPDVSGASHFYRAYLDGELVAQVQFQKGPRGEYGSLPGCIDGVLLAIIADRMRGFQSGPFTDRRNTRVELACRCGLVELKDRADERAERGVLGKAVA